MPPSFSPRALRRRGLALLGVLLAVAAGAAPAFAGGGVAGLGAVPAFVGGASSADGAGVRSTAVSDDGGPRDTVVVIGTAGLRWDDLDPAATPALWRLAETGAVGSLVTRSVRTASCPADGWLVLGAGNRAADEPPVDGCRTLAEPGADGAVPRWDVYLAERDAGTYGSSLGLLGALLEDRGLAALGVGPGAAVALATPEGTVVGEHAPWSTEPADLAATVGGALGAKDLVVVDAGVVPGGALADGAELGSRADQVAVVEGRVAAVVEALDGSDATLLLASLADGGPDPRLGVLSLHGFPGIAADPSGQVLVTGSTRQPGYVLATDLLPTLLTALPTGLSTAADDPEDLSPWQGHNSSAQMIGSVARGVAGARSGGERVSPMVDLDRHASAIRVLTPGFFALLIAINLALYAAVWLRMFRPTHGRRAVLGGFRVAGVVVGALPVATFLANLVPWWRADGAGLYLAVTGAVGLVTGLALLGPWRRAPLGPLTVVAAVTASTILLDVLTGSRLQIGSPMGVHPLVAGRFYGLNNSAFALLMVSSLLVAAVAGTALVARGRRGWGVGLVAAVGAVVTVVDGMPGLGSDFGGPPALVPAFAVLALLVAGVRVGWWRLVGVLGAGIVVVTAFAVADWLRPEADRTHLGRFVQTVLDGGLLDVVWRKLAQNFSILTSSWLVLLVAAGVGLVVWLAGRPRRRGATEGAGAGDAPARGPGVLAAAGAELPALRVALPAAATGLAIGFAVNDSGIVIPAIGMSLALPLVVATLAAWLGPLTGGQESRGPDDVRGAATTSG